MWFINNWRFIIGVLATLGLGWICYECQDRGANVVFLKGAVSRLDSLLVRKNDTIATERFRVRMLQKDTARLSRLLAQKQIDNLHLKSQISAGERAALLVDKAIQQGKANVNSLVNQMTALQKKIAADAGLAAENLGFTLGGTTVEQQEINDRIARLTGYGQVYNDSTETLKRLTGQQREEIDQLKAKNNVLTAENSDLYTTIVSVRNGVQDDFADSQKERHPFGFGQKKSKERLRVKVLKRLPLNY